MRYLLAALIVAATTGIAATAQAAYSVPDLEVLYFVAVMVAAVYLGRGPSIFAAALAVASYDFFFVPPFHTLSVSNARYFLTFAMMFGVGLLISELIARIRKQEQDVRSAALRAKTEETRSALLSAVSHDLRTPLASITGAATALRDDRGLGVNTRAELLETICDETERLERLVVNLLDMTRLESGPIVLKREWVPLEEMVGSALTRLERYLGERPVQTDLPESLPLLSVDPVLFEQVFVNLLENASRYTPSGSPLEIAARMDDTSVMIEIRDSGRGFAPGTEERVFEKFFRGEHAGKSGAGLGLPICRAIVEAHGGVISAENRPSGGALIRIVLPLVGQAPSIRPVPPNADEVSP
jgi:K+-sensing histidine kinase KdpD